MSEVTRILEAIEQGEPRATEELLPLVYDELRRLATHMMACEKPGQTLQPTALVHEAYLRLVTPFQRQSLEPAGKGRQAPGGTAPAGMVPGGSGDAENRQAHAAGSPRFAGRRHFFAAAAEAMRRILIESARRKGRQKRGGGRRQQEFRDDQLLIASKPDEVLAVHETLDALERANRAAAELVKLRYFAGFTIHEAAALLEISPRKANQIWAYARAWLLDKLAADND